MVLTNSNGIPRVPPYLGVRSRKSDAFRLRDSHPLWSSFPECSAIHQFGNFPTGPKPRPIRSHDTSVTTLSGLHNKGLGSSPFARRYSGNHSCFLFLRLLRCFSSPRSPHKPMDSVCDAEVLTSAGSPIQKSPDQCLFSSSPKLIAAIHVFHRLLAPRHPPFALISLATN